MKLCLKLACKGEGRVSPNPLVGSVIVNNSGDVLAEGYHRSVKSVHAEIDALQKLNYQATGMSLYVNLEPCNHTHRNPSCCEAIIKSGIKSVIIGMKDPNPSVNGRGIAALRIAKIEVIKDILKQECMRLNEVFVKNMCYKKPFIVVKTASTLDGKIGTRNFDSKWITSKASLEIAHRFRNRYDGILIGSRTIITDNPKLTCRYKGGRDPARIIIDSKGLTDSKSHVFENNGVAVFLAISEKIDRKVPPHIKILKCPPSPLEPNQIDLNYLLQKLYDLNIKSILVEGGGKLNGALLKYGLIDKILFFQAAKIIGDEKAITNFSGHKIDKIKDALNFEIANVKIISSSDLLIELYPVNSRKRVKAN